MISEAQRAAITATVERQFQLRREMDRAEDALPPRQARPTEKVCVRCETVFPVGKRGRITERCRSCAAPIPTRVARSRKARTHRRGCVECWHEGAPEAVVVQGGLCARHSAVVLEIERQAIRPFSETRPRLRRFLPDVWPEVAATADLAREGLHADVGPEEEVLLLAWGTTFKEAEDPRPHSEAMQRLGPRSSDVLLGSAALGQRYGDAIFEWPGPGFAPRHGRIGSRASRPYS